MSVVEQSVFWARELTRREARGPGDIEAAWHRLQHRYGVPFRTFWALRYRRPKTITADIYLRLCAAYQAECDRQMRKLRHELEITRTVAGADHAAVRAAAALVGEDNE
jgi:hypothetical protein